MKGIDEDNLILFAETLPAPRFLPGNVKPGITWILVNLEYGTFRWNRFLRDVGLFTFYRMDRKLQCDPSLTWQHLVPSCGKRQDFPFRIACEMRHRIYTHCVSCKILSSFWTNVLSWVCHPHAPNYRSLAWARATPFEACSNRGFIKAGFSTIHCH